METMLTLRAPIAGSPIRADRIGEGAVNEVHKLGADFQQISKHLRGLSDRVEATPFRDLLNAQLLMHQVSMRVEILSKGVDSLAGGVRRLQQG